MKYIYFIAVFVLIGCSNPVDTKETSQTLNRISLTKVIDLDSLNPLPIKSWQRLEHKILSKVGEKDSLSIAPDLYSKLQVVNIIKAKNDYQGDAIVQKEEIYFQGKVLFRDEVIAGVTTFEYDNQKKLLSFSIIKDQNFDTFATNSDLYLANLSANRVYKLKGDLTNTANAAFAKNQKFLFYLDDNKVFKLDLNNKTSKLAFEFSNSDYTILSFKERQLSKYEVVFMKDICSGEMFFTSF